MNLKKLAEFLEVLATLPDNEQEKVLAYAQGVSAGGSGGKVHQHRKG